NNWKVTHHRCRRGRDRWNHVACIAGDREDEMKDAVREWLWHHVPLDGVPEPPLEMPPLPF
ncbi:hypothetical protein LCGC14_1734820, partial [marine sediment metagenome]